jgi:hypothetical protein
MKLHPLTDQDRCPHCAGRLTEATPNTGEADDDLYGCLACGRQVAHCLSADGSCYLECRGDPWESDACSGPPLRDCQLADALRMAASLIPVLGTEHRLRVLGALSGALAARYAECQVLAQTKRPVSQDLLTTRINAVTERIQQSR